VKVLHIITGLSTGGAERALYNLLSGGLAARDGVVVLSLRDEGTYGRRIRELGVPVYTLGMRRGVPGPVAIARLCMLVRELRPDMIQGWMYHGNLAATLAGWVTPGRPPVAWNIRHSLYSLRDEKPLTRQVILANRCLSGRTDSIVYNSCLSREQHEAFGFLADRGRMIPNGFDTDNLQPSPDLGQLVRRDLAIPEDALVIGHVARFHPMKDHASFLRAAVQVARAMPNTRFLLAGRNVDLVNSALFGIVPSDFVGRFHFMGERDDVPALMQAMDIFCQSSWSEAFPNVLGEAMALGVPCVATDVGDSRDIVADTGMIVPRSDSEALARGLLAMLSKSSDERRALGSAARASVKANYALPRIVGEYQGLYEALASGAAGLAGKER